MLPLAMRNGYSPVYPLLMLKVAEILQLHDAANAHGHDPAASAPVAASPLEKLILAQHQANFALWHREDDARDPSAADATIVAAKRDIDRLNQQRNDLLEQVDAALLGLLPPPSQPAPLAGIPLHSETPGLILDRLSILSLKLFHTRQETRRSTPQHRARNQERLAVLQSQRDDLASCLAQLWDDLLAGRRRFKLYRQMKMYNDPSLNPVLYRQPK